MPSPPSSLEGNVPGRKQSHSTKPWATLCVTGQACAPCASWTMSPQLFHGGEGPRLSTRSMQGFGGWNSRPGSAAKTKKEINTYALPDL